MDKPLFTLSLSEFLAILDKRYLNTGSVAAERVHGIKGLANLFGCSTATAQRIKSSGIIDSAIYQIGRTFTVDADKALMLLQASNSPWVKKFKK